jgi:hypothetical protein
VKRLSAMLVAAALANAPAWADAISRGPDSVAVTFYHDETVETSRLLHSDRDPSVRDMGFAFITETRTVDLPAGPAVLKFEGIASTMVPQTADIQGLPAGLIEQNFDYDLLSPGSLLAKSIGESVRLVRTDHKTGKRAEETAIVRSGPDGAVLEFNGKFEALRCSGLPEKLIFDHVPGDLTDTPTLSARTVSPVAGRYTVKLSYIATGLNWSADYVARIQPDSDKLTLSGWLTLANFSATSFHDAPVDVVAGKLQTTGDDKPVNARAPVIATHCWPMDIDWANHARAAALARRLAGNADQGLYAPSPVTAVGQQEMRFQHLGDYILYPLPEPTTVAAQQTKQIQFLDRPDVAFKRIYGYILNSARDANVGMAAASVVLRLQNTADSGLGKPIPAGNVSVFERGPDNNLIFAGQDTIGDTSVGMPMEIETGRTMDVRVRPLLLESKLSGDAAERRFRDTWEITLENDKAVPIHFEFRQGLYEGQGMISSESPAYRTQYGYAIWDLDLAPGARTTVHYVVTHPDQD